MKWIIIIINLLTLFACSEKKARTIEKTKPSKKIKPSKETKQQFEPFPDSLCKILDEIEICKEYACFDSITCYDRNGIFLFYFLDTNSIHKKNFILGAPGGSGGNSIRLYKKVDQKNILQDEYFAFFDTILPQSNLGMKDFQLVYRDYDRGYIRVLHQWNREKYLPKKVIDINNIPMEMLDAMKIAKEDLNNPDGFIREYPGVSNMVYFELKLDTLFQGIEESLYQISILDWRTKKTEKCWIVKQTGNEYIPLTVMGTSYLTYFQEMESDNQIKPQLPRSMNTGPNCER